MFCRFYEKIQTDQLGGKPSWNFKLLGLKCFSLIFVSLLKWELNVMLGLWRHRGHTQNKSRLPFRLSDLWILRRKDNSHPLSHHLPASCHWASRAVDSSSSLVTIPSTLLHKREFSFVLCMYYQVKIERRTNKSQFFFSTSTHILFLAFFPCTHVSHLLAINI